MCYFYYHGTSGNTTDYTIVKGAVFSDDRDEVLPLGEVDGEEVFCAVARTGYGRTPGQALRGFYSYAYGGNTGFERCYETKVSFLGPRKTPLDVAAAENKAKASI